jgi:peptide deformylase
MHEAAGIGLAAQQVNVARQLCVVDLREAEEDFDWLLDGAHPPLSLFMPMIIANPVITIAKDTPNEIVEEGCLSFPEIRGDVKRPEEISVKFQDENGVPHTLICNGLLARCILHEADHLAGVLFIDQMTKKTYAKIDEAVKALALATKAAAK